MAQRQTRKQKLGMCPLCRRTISLTFHHLIPKKMHRRAHFKKHYSKQQLQAGIDICRRCHDGVHDIYNEMQLAKHFSSLEALQRDPLLQNHFQWVSRQKA